jgi:hypothetical protein
MPERSFRLAELWADVDVDDIDAVVDVDVDVAVGRVLTGGIDARDGAASAGPLDAPPRHRIAQAAVA